MNGWNLYWGDIHNHCDITYGYGSLDNALQRAASHLDFCAVTGHAMWPDMPPRTPETAFVVDFHRRGFEKLRNNWLQVREKMAAANTRDLVTFQAYEMHSNEYGDHHLVSPSDQLPLLYRSSPEELVRDAGVPAIAIAHHIGYTPGYRGINWDKFDAAITPLVEVCSKHGCSMSEHAPYPYYHTMGPRDSRNTVYEGLRRGLRFGFVGSTDHHAGFPGSYGDGKMAVWAAGKTRQDIWQAMLQRRVYAVTGDRIRCEFEVDGAPMGAAVKAVGDERKIRYTVSGGDMLDKVVIYKNLRPIKVVEGLLLAPVRPDGRCKVRVEMGWGGSQQELFRWMGSVKLEKGRLLSVEPCFRGRSVLAPSTTDTNGCGDINNLQDRILQVDENGAAWQCETTANLSPLHPQTSAVIMELQGDDDTVLEITVNGITDRVSLAQLLDKGYSHQTKPYHSPAFKVHTAVPQGQYEAQGILIDQSGKAGDFYHMEVYQANGSCAFVSPVWME